MEEGDLYTTSDILFIQGERGSAEVMIIYSESVVIASTYLFNIEVSLCLSLYIAVQASHPRNTFTSHTSPETCVRPTCLGSTAARKADGNLLKRRKSRANFPWHRAKVGH